jgi:uncharacterized protein (TIGR02231 family)
MTDLQAPIREVTVYPDRALVTRRGRATLEPGEHELTVAGLPMLERESLRATGRGLAGMRILGVDVGTAYHGRAPEPEIEALRERVEQRRHALRLLEAREQALDDRRTWLRGLGEQSKDFARGLAQGQMKPQDCADFFRFMSEQALQDAQDAEGLERETRRLRDELDALERELEDKQGGTRPDRLVASVTVAVPEAGEVELDVSYLVLGASWRPRYDLRVDVDDAAQEGEAEGVVELTTLGIVSQRTGETWAGVDLALSTARPSLAAVLPELTPWYLRAPQTAPVYGRRRAAVFGQPAPAGAPLAAEAPAPEAVFEAEPETAIAEEAGAAVLFRVPRQVDIPSDGTPHRTVIDQGRLPCRMDWVTAPVLDEHAHLHAEVTNELGHVLLPGEAGVFHGGDYVGTVAIEQTAPGATFDAYLGIDDRLEVKRELVERAVDKGTILQTGIRRTTYGYRLAVRSRAPGRRRVTVRDRLPVSQHERVKVRLLSMRPEPTQRTGLELVTWAMTLEPEKERVIEYRFLVEQPADLPVVGLPDS